MTNYKRSIYEQSLRAKAIAITASTKPWGRISDAYKRYKWTATNPTLTGFLVTLFF